MHVHLHNKRLLMSSVQSRVRAHLVFHDSANKSQETFLECSKDDLLKLFRHHPYALTAREWIDERKQLKELLELERTLVTTDPNAVVELVFSCPPLLEASGFKWVRKAFIEALQKRLCVPTADQPFREAVENALNKSAPRGRRQSVRDRFKDFRRAKRLELLKSTGLRTVDAVERIIAEEAKARAGGRVPEEKDRPDASLIYRSWRNVNGDGWTGWEAVPNNVSIEPSITAVQTAQRPKKTRARKKLRPVKSRRSRN
jgi:hypothetical protein